MSKQFLMINNLHPLFCKLLMRKHSYLFVFTAVFCVCSTNDVTAQYLHFSSTGTTHNFDSLYDNLAAENKARINPSLYRSKSDSVLGLAKEYRGRYSRVSNQFNGLGTKHDSTFRVVNEYRNRYGSGGKDLLENGRFSGQPDIFRNHPSLKAIKKIQHSSGAFGSLSKQILSGAIKPDSNTVLNNKMMQSYIDSLNKVIPKIPTVPFQEVPREQLVKEVNERFNDRLDSLKGSTRWVGEIQKRKQWADLNYDRIKNADKEDLKPMAVSIVKAQVLKRVDSLRDRDLKALGLKMTEHETDAREQIARFREKQSLWEKSYLEGLLSLAANPTAKVQFSPAWAYHFLPSWSVGGGPNLIINRQSGGVKLDVGARVLTKYEMFNRSVYFQVEDQIMPAAVGAENKLFTQHSFMAGGGYVVPLLSPVTLNLSAMYKFYSNGVALNDGSPWIFRIGISSNKKQK
jgi:hypothetical protein